MGGFAVVARAAGRAFPGRSELSLDPDLRAYLDDLVRPYGLALREDLLEQGVGHSYGEMAEALIRETVPEDEPVDLLILAYALPDVRPGRSTALYLSSVCPGRPFAFGVCDQGIAAPYTAVQLALEYLRAGAHQRALILVAEQSALHYELVPQCGVAPALPQEHAAVALVLDGLAGHGVSEVGEYPGLAPEQAGAVLTTRLAELYAAEPDPRRRVLVVGAGLAKIAADGLGIAVDRVIAAEAGRPCTGAWQEFTDGYSDWTEHECSIVLADYDAGSQTLCFAAVRAGRP